MGVAINRGGSQVNLTAGTRVTAAEFAAFHQVRNGGQTIVLDAQGAASGGNAFLSSTANNTSIMAPNGAINFGADGAGTATINTGRIQMDSKSVAVSSVDLLASDAVTANITGGAFSNTGILRSVTANGSGSIVLRGIGGLTVQTGNLSVASQLPADSDGGTIDIGTTGILSLGGSGPDASATGSGNHKGGAIYILAADIVHSSGLAFVLAADAQGDG